MKKTYVMRDGKLVEKALAAPTQGNSGPFIIDDIQPYQSMLTGEMITTRTRHRNLLREHGCIEVGNETKYLKQKQYEPAPGLKAELIRQVKKHRGN